MSLVKVPLPREFFCLIFRAMAAQFPVHNGVIAQLVEHHNGIVGVWGSNPHGSTLKTGRDFAFHNQFLKRKKRQGWP